jgi:hypothetical protein
MSIHANHELLQLMIEISCLTSLLGTIWDPSSFIMSQQVDFMKCKTYPSNQCP